MSYFIVLHGPLGCGKSTIAEHLAKKLDAFSVHLDEVLSANGLDRDIPEDGGIPAVNFIKAIDLALPIAKQNLEQRKIVIFDGCFYHREVMQYLLDNLKYPHRVFTLKAPLEVCIQRDKHRPNSLGEDAARAVYKFVLDMDFGMVIDNNRSLEEVLSEIESILNR